MRTWRATGRSNAPSSVGLRYAQRYTGRIAFTSFGSWDYTATLKRVDAPLLVIYGDRDATGLRAQRAWAAAAAAGRLLVVAGAKDQPHVDRPDIVFAAIDSFLAGRWPDGAQPVSP